ncbi:MAG: transporter substrate-binding domain-containing protein [Bacteroidales bacterium]|nr:transporter substrate-binding domain-containing protein [Bacteroidales bacterium]
MRKFFFTIATILFLLVPYFSYSQDTIPSTIVYGGDEAFPPYEFLNKKGEPEGFNIDLIRYIAKQMGFKVKIKLAPWNEIAGELEHTDSIQVASMYFSEKRAQLVDFASPIEMSYYELYLKKGTKFSDLKSLEGKTVAIENGSVLDEYFTENYPGVILMRYPSEVAALEALSKGECYAAFASNIINYNLIKAEDLNNLFKYHKPFLPRLYSFAVKKENTRLLNLLNIGLLKAQEDGVFHNLRKKWINDQKESWLTKNSKWILTAILILIIWFISWIIVLRYSINIKTKELGFANSRLRLIASFKPTRIDKISAQEQVIKLLEHIKETFKADACIVRILKDNQLELFESVGIESKNLVQMFPANEGFGKKVIEARKALGFKNVANESTHNKIKNKYPNLFSFVSYAGAPLIFEGKVIGIIGVYSKTKKHEFSSDELEHFQIVADQLAVSFENTLLFEQNEKQKEILVKQIVSRKAAESELQKSFQTTNTLYEISKELSLSLDMMIIGSKILKSLEKLLKSQRSSIWLMDENRRKVSLIAFSDFNLKGDELQKEIQNIKNKTKKPGEGIIGWVSLNGENFRSGNVKKDERFHETNSGVKSVLCVPIILEGISIGCINIESFEKNIFSEEDERLLTAISNLSSSTIQNARLFEKLNFELAERTRAEREVEKLNKDLELRVEQRTEELRASNKEMESFVYSISHDLRAPLRSITGFAEIISRRHKANLNEEGQEYFEYILEAANNMANLINDLLQFSRLAKNPLSKTPVDLNEVLESVQKNLNQDIIDKKATIILSGKMPIVKGDRSLIGQIFSNLVQNAIKYHRTGVDPKVVISVIDDEKSTVIKIQDNGMGIPPEHFEKIFDIFQRLHSNETYPGTGIGLAIVKKAITALGGTVWLESKIGEGTTFFVQFSKN